MRDEEQFVCALSGLTSEPSPEDDSDGLDDLPVGWTRITISRRQLNPEWVEVQQVKERLVEAFLEQIQPDMREAQRRLFEIQISAQFHGLESSIPRYVADVEDILDCSEDGEVIETLNAVREQLGLDPMPPLEEDDEEE